jgi:GDPmannose 4,6-dehydratase
MYEDPHLECQHFVPQYGDLAANSNLTRARQQVQPDEVDNPRAQSHVAVSFEEPEYTADVDAIGTLRTFEAIRFLRTALLRAHGHEAAVSRGSRDLVWAMSFPG